MDAKNCLFPQWNRHQPPCASKTQGSFFHIVQVSLLAVVRSGKSNPCHCLHLCAIKSWNTSLMDDKNSADLSGLHVFPPAVFPKQTAGGCESSSGAGDFWLLTSYVMQDSVEVRLKVRCLRESSQTHKAVTVNRTMYVCACAISTPHCSHHLIHWCTVTCTLATVTMSLCNVMR